MSKINLDITKAYGWGVFSYMLHSLKKHEDGTVAVDRLHFRHSIADAGSEKKAIEYAQKYSGEYFAMMVYFVIPMKTSKFGDLRNKGFIGFSANNNKFIRFKKPLLSFDAMETIEDTRKRDRGS